MINDLVVTLVSPLGLALIAWALSLLVLAWRPLWRRMALLLGIVGFAWLLVFSLPVASDALRGSIENQAGAREIAALPAFPVAVVLGGGVSGAQPPQRPAPDLTAAADRLWHAARLYHAGKAQRLLVSGGVTRPGQGSEAAAMRVILLELGVPDAAIVLEQASVNTSTNAARSAEWLRAQQVDRILLVTSALHMRRARGLFERAGMAVVPAPTDFEVVPEPFALRRVLPSASALEGSARAVKELVGAWVGR